jgi:MoaA/NifB/PqqE/SkfB family radical SAM enzyme
MNFIEKLSLGNLWLKTILFNKSVPIFVSWAITERCNLRCQYCQVWNTNLPELSTADIMRTLDILSKKGMRFIRLTGGEPLLRDDISDIINYSCSLGVITTIATNGFMLGEKIGEIKKLDNICITLEGPEEIHNRIRGTGSHHIALEALKIAEESNIPISIAVTLNTFNLDSIGYLLDMAKKFNARIYFQPADIKVLYGEKSNPVCANIDAYRKTILCLLKAKKKSKNIGNSTAGLRYLYNWPEAKKIKCMAGKVMCRLDSFGNIYPCSRFIIKDEQSNIMGEKIEHCLSKLYSPKCNNCWCSALVELNLIASFNLSAILNYS